MDSDIHHNLPHWNYFRLLERDLEESFRYIHPCPDHYSVYSDHFARIILMACTEIENCLREFANETQYKPQPKNINDFYKCVSSKFTRFNETKLFMPRYSLSFEPWSEWTNAAPPEWWTSGYNKIKHNRLDYPNTSTMNRAISSVAALLALLYHHYRVICGPDCMMPGEIAPVLFELDEIGRAGIYLGWTLPDEREDSANDESAQHVVQPDP